MKTKTLKILLFVCLCLILAACTAAPTAAPAPTPTQTSPPPNPVWTSTYWPVSTPEEQGLDSEELVAMIEWVESMGYDVDSVVIIRHGALVLDVSFHPYKSGTPHQLYSCSKSVISALIGIAIEQGYIEGVNQPVLSFFPDREVENMDADKEAMTLEHLLTMSTGFDCRDSYLHDWVGFRDMQKTDDWVQHILDLRMLYPPGTHFEYCNGATFLLSAIIQETTGMTALEYAEENLFKPLGITGATWEENPQGINLGFSDLFLTPQDMAKFGSLYLHEGVWEGAQIVPAEWVKASSTEFISATLQDGYGYQFWIDDAGYYMALGYNGQFIFVLPELDMVVVIVSDPVKGDYEAGEEMLTRFIIPAVSDTPLPPNPEGLRELNRVIEDVAKP